MNVQLDALRDTFQSMPVSALSASRATTGYGVARELVGRHVWTSGQRRALRMAATLGVNIADFAFWVNETMAEVEK